MDKLIMILFVFYITYLIIEAHDNNKNRKSFLHVIHVNGTRGKSSTTRLIDAALRDTQYRIFSKTTGTSPRTIDINGIEEPITRKGKANIKEQIKIIRKAAVQKADILVIECMAVNPNLQYITQNKILKADISVVTNVRRDHLEVMGPTLNDVAVSLGNVMPKNGTFITAEKEFIDYYDYLGKSYNTKVILSREIEDDYGIDFSENVSIALEVCSLLGIDKERAIKNMKKNYKKDPGVLTNYKIRLKDDIIIDFINGFSINDPDSIKIIFERYQGKDMFTNKKFIVLINNRGDRIHRLMQHTDLIYDLKPDKVWIIGENSTLMKNNLIKIGFQSEDIFIIKENLLNVINSLKESSAIFAIGNIGDNGEKIIEDINKVGDLIE